MLKGGLGPKKIIGVHSDHVFHPEYNMIDLMYPKIKV